MVQTNTGNNIYRIKNVESYPAKVKLRVLKFLKFIEEYRNCSAYVADLGAGNCFIESCKMFLEVDSYDYYPTKNAKFLDLLEEVDIKRTYNIIIMNHVLEHFEFPVKILQNIKPIIDEKTEIFMALPNSDYAQSKHQPFNKDIGHLSYFNARNVHDIFNAAGYKIKILTEMNEISNYEELFLKAMKI